MTSHTKSAILFPGQGSQSVGMLALHISRFPAIAAHFDRASALLGYDLKKLVQEGPAEQLNETVYTQPALLVAGFALWEIYRLEMGMMPAWVAGHSLGEYTALVAAESLRFEDAVLLVAKRGELMQHAVPIGSGAMAAIIGLSLEQTSAWCEKHRAMGAVVDIANINEPQQLVISGEVKGVEQVMEEAKQAGAKLVRRLPVSVPSHSPLMRGAAEALGKFLETINIQPPKFRVVHNVDLHSYEDPKSIRAALVKQLYSPVRWSETIKLMVDQGVDLFIESGPGQVLTNMTKRIAPTTRAVSLTEPGLTQTEYFGR